MSLSPSANDYLAPLENTEAVSSSPVSEPLASLYAPRSKFQPIFFFPAIVAATLSTLAGGVPVLTDLAWLIITFLCVLFLITELRAFSFRFGIGGLLIFGGSLIWLCYDYLTNWFNDGKFRSISNFPEEPVARATLAVALFIPFTLLGTRIALRGVFERNLAKLPGPVKPHLWLVMALILFLIGLLPYAFFTQEGLFVSYFKDFFAGRGGGGALWTVGRTGNANYSYGAYLAQVIQVGIMGSLLGAYYAIVVARTTLQRVAGMLIWLPSFIQAFGTGTRGAVVLIGLPVIGFLFIRYQAEAAALGRRVSRRGYIGLATALAIMLVVVQTQITFRNSGFQNADLEQVNVTAVEGNSMFSESIAGFAQIPNNIEPFYATFPGQAIIYPIYDTAFWFVVSPIPRAVWTTKPFDPVQRWYNTLVGGSKDGIEGTTIVHGTVGYWYFRFGMLGVVQGGLIFGFLIGVAERLLQRYWHRPLAIITSLGMMTFFFRAFRSLNWIEFHATMVGIAALCMLYVVLRFFLGDEPQPALDQPPASAEASSN